MDEGDPEDIRVHEAVWKRLYDEVGAVFSEFSRQGLIGEEEYFVVPGDWGWNRLQTELVLSPLWHEFVRRFQLILVDYPDWWITMQVMRNEADGWPGMGVIVAVDGIQDELKREHLPEGLRSLTFDE